MGTRHEYLEERKRANLVQDKNVVCLQDIVLELMNEWKVSMADIQKGTGIPWPTLQNWLVDGKPPMVGSNILALSKFFNCSINYLAFGIGEEPEIPSQIAAIKARKERENDSYVAAKEKTANLIKP